MEKICRGLYYYMRYWLIKHKVYAKTWGSDHNALTFIGISTTVGDNSVVAVISVYNKENTTAEKLVSISPT